MRQLVLIDFFADPLMADIEILAEITQQVTMGEKNRAGTIASD